MLIWVIISGVPSSTNLLWLILVTNNVYCLNSSLLRDAWGVYILVGYMPKKKKKDMKGGKETREETSEKSEEQEGKFQGAYRRGKLFADEAKNGRDQ